ncbi:MAG: hypothetical protein JNK46_07980 [Methylobacteriaceae bacterium]|nr:hypothetical protein [Methylobacteriaceae bacterium]
MSYAQRRPSPGDIRVVKALATAVIVAPVALSLFAVLASGTTGYGARRASLLISEAQASAPQPRGPARSIAVNAQTPRLVTHAPRGAALGEAILQPVFVDRARAGAATSALAAAPARPPARAALLRVASRGGPLVAPRALDAVRLESEGLTIRLAGVEPLPAEALCKRLDGVMESCAERAASRIAVLMHGRDVVCRLSAEDGATEAAGVCKAGKIDIAEDLARAGLVRRSGASLAAQARTAPAAI